ncbi:MAG: sulfur carrier protein ThiS [Candidatus Saganbacteria bacterium]|nr:sulfur carrier protein ThiS [Candidatus Saganbacteria bacterium]
MLKIKINGKEWEVPAQTNIENVLSRFKTHPQICVIEVNQEIIPRENYRQRFLEEGDQIEVIRFMAGG